MKLTNILELIRQATANYIAAFRNETCDGECFIANKMRRRFMKSAYRLIKMVTVTRRGRRLLKILLEGGLISVGSDELVEEMINLHEFIKIGIANGLRIFIEAINITE